MSKLTLKEKVSYGLGDFGNGFMFDMGQIYLLKFYTDVFGIPAAVAGSIFLLTKIFDAFMDPIAGAFIDARKADPRTGKFRKIMFTSSIFLGILSIFVFMAPDLSPTAKMIFGYATYMAWGVGYSFTNVPYGALGAAMTQDPNDRASLASWRQAGSLGALLITSVMVVPLIKQFSDPRVAWPVVVALTSVIGVTAFYFCFKNCKEVIVGKSLASGEKISIKAMARSVFTNRPLLALILMTIFTISAYNIKSAMMIYYCQYNLGDISLMPYISFITIGCSCLGITLIPKLTKRFGKKNTALIGFGVSVVADLINFLIPGDLVTFTILASIAFIGISIPNGVTWAFVSDSIDYGEWKTGERREGITYSFFNFARKIAQSVSGFASGIGLSIVGYVPNVQQTEKALGGIKGLLLLYPAVTISCAALVIGILYTLSDKRHGEMIEELKNRPA
ncbi:glycoside-pentoside-hexuronide (GPH):cation symporter [Pelosinus baikalensis]|uniref:Glycoside-pentoside-hexuronide (GPH):cation symporter n=1 Tax=Pelosinus baikalensis TaxID=2892015 RepID=A0ABS8HY16_9FIRM|nr:glycoside-pentoside-hexuronide (GPH):cation symporter [Pelosinus baikalensis]MCC5466884.1 glycoside-pentoside-hexuronide (GPH):cation symporter [Pelosinus baikalensis]